MRYWPAAAAPPALPDSCPNSGRAWQEEQISELQQGADCFWDAYYIQTLADSLFLWLYPVNVGFVSPLVRESPCSLPLWVSYSIGSCSAHCLYLAAFQEQPLTKATLGVAWHLISLHVFLTWFLDSPYAFGGRHSWRCACMGKVHTSAASPVAAAQLCGRLQPLEHQMGIGTPA